MLISKLQIPNYKQITISNDQNHNRIFWSLWFRHCILFVICVLFIGILNVYALDLDKVKVAFLSGDYKQAIVEGEKIIAGSGAHSAGLDELYYLLAVSYLKDGNLLRASDIFEIILGESKSGRFREEAMFGLADTYLLREDFTNAENYYLNLMKSNPDSKLKAQVYYRLAQIKFKQGNTQQAEEYMNLVKRDFPAIPELKSDKALPVFSDSGNRAYYTVQIGAFSKGINARNLRDKLIKKGYDAYVEELNSTGNGSYRVRIGKFKSRTQAAELEKKLSSEGYPTKIYP